MNSTTILNSDDISALVSERRELRARVAELEREVKLRDAELEEMAALAKREVVADGFVLVPADPTWYMLDAGYRAQCSADYEEVGDVYRAMLAASQQPAQRERNQCDGCMAGHSVDDHGHHYTPNGPYMACQAYKYAQHAAKEGGR